MPGSAINFVFAWSLLVDLKLQQVGPLKTANLSLLTI